jgi:hypothetical protein
MAVTQYLFTKNNGLLLVHYSECVLWGYAICKKYQTLEGDKSEFCPDQQAWDINIFHSKRN